MWSNCQLMYTTLEFSSLNYFFLSTHCTWKYYYFFLTNSEKKHLRNSKYSSQNIYFYISFQSKHVALRYHWAIREILFWSRRRKKYYNYCDRHREHIEQILLPCRESVDKQLNSTTYAFLSYFEYIFPARRLRTTHRRLLLFTWTNAAR